MRKRDIFLFLTAAVVLAADQLTKLWIRTHIPLGQSLFEDAPVRLTHVPNQGVVFGLRFGPLSSQTFLIALGLVMSVAVIVVYYNYPLFVTTWLRIGLGLVLGGAVGNLTDRLHTALTPPYIAYVTDFIDLRVWPVFNLADSAIVSGVGLLACILVFRRQSAGEVP